MNHSSGRYLPKLQQLASFIAVARSRSFTEAAEVLHITQSAVSRQVKELEEFLDKPLFLRNTREAVLTAAGRDYLEKVAPLLEHLEVATREAMQGEDEQRQITISCQSTYGVRWLMPRLEAFQVQHPDTRIHLQTHLGHPDLGTATADAYIVNIAHGQVGWSVDWMLRGGGYPVASSRVLAPYPDGKNALLHLPLLDQRATPMTWPHYFELLGLDRGAIRKGPTYSLLTMGLHAAVSGVGVAMLPEFVFEDEVLAGNLVKVVDRRLNREEKYGLFIGEGKRKNPVLKAFREWLLVETEVYLQLRPLARP